MNKAVGRPRKRLIKDAGPHPIDRFVGSRVRKRRLQLERSQTAVARELGVSFQAVQKYESGDIRIATSTLYQLCEILGVGPAYFFKGYPPKNADQD